MRERLHGERQGRDLGGPPYAALAICQVDRREIARGSAPLGAMHRGCTFHHNSDKSSLEVVPVPTIFSKDPHIRLEEEAGSYHEYEGEKEGVGPGVDFGGRGRRGGGCLYPRPRGKEGYNSSKEEAGQARLHIFPSKSNDIRGISSISFFTFLILLSMYAKFSL